MNLDFTNNLFNNLKKKNNVQNFIKELSSSLKNNTINNKNINIDYSFNNLLEDNLMLYGEKITAKFRDKMLIERASILQSYNQNTSEKGEMYYIYNINTDENNYYNICNCNPKKSNDVITKKINELPNGATLGSVLRKQGQDFILDNNTTQIVGEKINTMIKEKIEEQQNYLNSKRIEGHKYKVGEKYLERIWLYDLDNVVNGGIEGIEEIKFPKELYEDAKEGDLFVYQNGAYQKHI